MSLIDHILYEENYFIKISEAIDLIEQCVNEPPSKIAIYLASNLFHVFVPMYSKNKFAQFYLDDSWVYEPNVIKTSVCTNTNKALEGLSRITDLKSNGLLRVPAPLSGNYWLRHDFFNNDAILALGIMDSLLELQTDNIYLDARKAEAERISKVRKIQQELELEKISKGNEKAKKNENLSTRERNNALKIIAALARMANLPQDQPFVAFNMLEAFATQNDLEIPSKDTVARWLKDANSEN